MLYLAAPPAAVPAPLCVPVVPVPLVVDGLLAVLGLVDVDGLEAVLPLDGLTVELLDAAVPALGFIC